MWKKISKTLDTFDVLFICESLKSKGVIKNAVLKDIFQSMLVITWVGSRGIETTAMIYKFSVYSVLGRELLDIDCQIISTE